MKTTNYTNISIFVGDCQFEIDIRGTVLQRGTTRGVIWPHIGGLFLETCSGILTGPTDSYEMAAHTMTEPPPRLTPGKRQCGLNSLAFSEQKPFQPANKDDSPIRELFICSGLVSLCKIRNLFEPIFK